MQNAHALISFAMRYHYAVKSHGKETYGSVYTCDHPVYDRCTLYLIRDKGLAVIRQYYDPELKCTYWKELGKNLATDIFLHSGFEAYFNKRAGPCKDGLYPTVTVRQIMWALRMKPLPKKRWETVFDRKDI